MGSLEAQVNIRNNVRDMHSTVQELYEWEKDIQKKDNRLRKGKSVAPSPRSPAVRGKAASVQPGAPELMRPAAALDRGQQGKSVPKSQPATTGSHAAGHTYEHSKDRWAKFDVDAALAEVDQEPGPSTEPQADVQNKLQAPPVRQARTPEEDAEFWKKKGNEYFKFGDHKKAKECYSSSIGAQGTAAAYANRGLACLKLKEWEQTISDCTQALALDPAYIKALQRRAAALKEVGHTAECLADADAALRLAPSSTAASTELRSVLRSHAQSLGLRMPDHMVDIPVRGVELLASLDTPSATEGILLPGALTSPTGSAPRSEPVPVALSAVNTASEQAAQSGVAAPPASPADIGGPALRGSSQLHVVAQPVPRGAAHGGSAGTQANAAAAPAADAGDACAAQGAAAPAIVRAAAGPTVEENLAAWSESRPVPAPGRGSDDGCVKIPSTSAEFESYWRGCKSDRGKQAAYLAAIPSARLPLIIKSSLTPIVLAGVAECALQEFVCSACAADAHTGVAILQAMTRVDRFGMNVMLMNAKHKAAVRQAWDAARGSKHAAAHADSLSKLQKQYKM